jgi:hypothetical protein
MVRTGIKTDAANLHNNEIVRFYRLWQRYCYTNPAAITISVEVRSPLETEGADRDRCRTFWLKGKNCIGSEKNEKLAPSAIGVEV